MHEGDWESGKFELMIPYMNQNEAQRFAPFKELHNHQLLWVRALISLVDRLHEKEIVTQTRTEVVLRERSFREGGLSFSQTDR